MEGDAAQATGPSSSCGSLAARAWAPTSPSPGLLVPSPAGFYSLKMVSHPLFFVRFCPHFPSLFFTVPFLPILKEFFEVYLAIDNLTPSLTTANIPFTSLNCREEKRTWCIRAKGAPQEHRPGSWAPSPLGQAGPPPSSPVPSSCF